MGNSCTITAVCGLAKEAKQYIDDDNAINKLVALSNSREFRRAVEYHMQEHTKGIVVHYHNDGSPTYQSMMMVLGVEKKLSDLGQSMILDKLDEIAPFMDKAYDVKAMVTNKLKPLARQVNKNYTTSEAELYVGGLDYQQAITVATNFNLLNAARDKYFAIVESGSKITDYRVKIVENNDKNRKKIKKTIPQYAAIQAAIDFFRGVGLEVHMDVFNSNQAGSLQSVIVDEKNETTNTTEQVVRTLISICSNMNSDYIEDLPNQVSHNVAVMAARVFMEAAKRNPEFKETIGYQRLEAAVQRYINTEKDKRPLEKIMEEYIAAEIEARINRSILNMSNEATSSNRLEKYVRHRVKTMFDRVIQWFIKHGYANKNSLLNKWRSEKFQNKKISLEKIRREAMLAVDDMFRNKEMVKTAFNHTDIEETPSRQNLKRYTNEQLRLLKDRHSKGLKLLIDINTKFKKHLKILEGKDRIKESTRFENIIDDLENSFNATNDSGAVKSHKDIASQAMCRVAIQLDRELEELDNDINSLSEKMLRKVPDYNDVEYMELISLLLMLHSRFKSLCDVREDILTALSGDEPLLNPVVQRITPNGVEESNLKALIDTLAGPIGEIQKSLETNIQKANLDLLELIIGTDSLNIIFGKMSSTFNVWISEKFRKGKGRASDYIKYKAALEKAAKDGRHYEVRDLLLKQLENPGILRNSLWHRVMGSPLNSASILNQVAYLAINKANMEAHNKTQVTLDIIVKGRRKYTSALKQIIERDENGIPTGNLITPIDYRKYETELAEAEKEWGEQFTERYKDRELTHDLIAILWKSFRHEKFSEWNRTEINGKPALKFLKLDFEVIDPAAINDEHPRTIKFSMYAPNKKIYKNYGEDSSVQDYGVKPSPNTPKRWDNLSKELLEASNWFFALKYLSDEKLNGLGSGAHKIPMFRGGKFDTFWGNNVTHVGTLAQNTLKRSFLHDIEDLDFGAPVMYIPYGKKSYRDTDDDVNNATRRIPLYGIRKLENMDTLSTDLYSSYLAYEDMSNNYEAKNNVEILLSGVRDLAYGNLSKNEAQRIQEKPKIWEGHTFRHEFENFVDKELYGIKKDDITLGSFGISMAKIFNHIGRITTTLFLGGNIHSSFVNLITGYNEIIKEAGVGEFINKKDLMKALATYTHLAQFKKIYLKPTWANKNAPQGFAPYILRQPVESPSLVNQILRDFDFTERFVSDIRRYTTKTMKKIYRNAGLLRLIMLPYEVTDHWMQAVPLIAMLNHEKVYISVPSEKEEGKMVQKKVSLMKALYGNLTTKYDFIDTGNRFGIFYKDLESAKEGPKLIHLLEKISANINSYHNDHLYTLENLASETPEYKKILEDCGGIPTTIQEFENVRTELDKKLKRSIYTNSDLSRFQLKAREIVNRMHGVYDTKSKGAFNRTLLGATVLSMKNYAVGLINKRLILGHWNIVLNKWDEGSLITVAKVINSAWADGVRQAKFGKAFKTVLGLISPYMFDTKWALREKFGWLNLNKSLRTSGFSEDLIRNLKRAKLDALRIFFWGFLNHVIYGLGSGWIGGFDDDDDKELADAGKLSIMEQMMGFFEARGITKQSIEDGSAFERGGGLYSDVSFKTVFRDALGLSDEDVNSLDNLDSLSEESQAQVINDIVSKIPHSYAREADFIKEYIIPHWNDMFNGYGGKGGINALIDNWYTDWCDKNNYYWTDKSGRRKRGWGGGKGFTIFPSKFEKLLKETLGDGSHLPKTIMQLLTEDINTHKKELDNLVTKYENSIILSEDDRTNMYKTVLELLKKLTTVTTDRERESILKTISSLQSQLAISLTDALRTELYEKIQDRKLQLTALNFAKDGYNRYKANRDLPELRRRELQYLAEYGYESLAQLKASLVSTDGIIDDNIVATREVKRFLETYEQTQQSLISSEKALRSRTFEKTYFKLAHPNAYYWLGVANFFAERALLEQESFIPFADLLARKGGGVTANLMTELMGGEPVKPLEYKYNMLNEFANLAGLPAAAGALTSVSNYVPELLDYLFGPNEKEYNLRLDQLRKLRDSTEDEQEKEEIQYEINRMLSDWESHHAQNKSARLKKGEHKVKKWGSFIPYYRTLYMLGFFDYMDNTGLEGGWNTANSFKSYFYKEDK